MSENISVDAVFVAQQFERINTTLEHFGKALDRANDKADAQDRTIDRLVEDIAELKADSRATKDSIAEIKSNAKPVRMHPAALVGVIVSPILVVAGLVATVIISLLP